MGSDAKPLLRKTVDNFEYKSERDVFEKILNELALNPVWGKAVEIDVVLFEKDSLCNEMRRKNPTWNITMRLEEAGKPERGVVVSCEWRTPLQQIDTDVSSEKADRPKPMRIFQIPVPPSATVDFSPLQGKGIRSLIVREIRNTGFFRMKNSVTSYVPPPPPSRITDISELRGMRLEKLSLVNLGVSDLRPLKGMPLRTLTLDWTQVSDLSPLTSCPLQELSAFQCKELKDIEPLSKLKLVRLNLRYTHVRDISPIKGMTSLDFLDISSTDVRDISALKGMKLQELKLPAHIKDVSIKGLELQQLQAPGVRTSSVNSPGPKMNLSIPAISENSKADDKIQSELFKALSNPTAFQGRFNYNEPYKSKAKIIKELLRQGADVNGRDNTGVTPLQVAVISSGHEEVATLLENGADSSIKDSEGYTALHLACRVGGNKFAREIIELLLKHKADVNTKGKNGYTPLHVAAECGNLMAIRLLVAAGADLEAGESYGWTPLHRGAYSADVVKLLLEMGADVDAKTAKFNYTVEQLVTKPMLAEDRTEVVKIIKAHRNRTNTNNTVTKKYPPHW